MELKITTLIENMPGEDARLKFEHGLSLYIEFDGRKILFDTGQTGDYIENAELLGIDLKEIDTFIVSHGHYDHSGGVMKTIDLLRPGTKMYVGWEFFEPKYKILEDKSGKYNGNAFTENDISDKSVNLIKVNEDVTVISGNIIIFKNFKRKNDFEKINSKFVIKKDGEIISDDFFDEIALGLITHKGLVVIAGCSHVGIINILSNIQEKVRIPIYAVIGGTHLVEADNERIDKTVAAFHEMNIEYIAVSHCTGENAIEKIKKEFNNKFILNNTGNEIYL